MNNFLGVFLAVSLIFILSACQKQRIQPSFQSVPVEPMPEKKQAITDDQEPGELALLVQNIEGKTDSAEMTLAMKTWVWINTQYNNDSSVMPLKPDVFTITFDEDQRVKIGTDCNRMQAAYKVELNQIKFGDIFSTRMYCKGSQEKLFEAMLKKVSSYSFTSRGQLILELKYDSGSIVFQ
jgi:heat shock protein HslJ